mmetsp:Transcript_38631/g.71398  ORF Transcript_38631/g.71398 Transcript_38631/m.71398 type:complete len:1275 (-) Transcript_38631:396-4220(-)
MATSHQPATAAGTVTAAPACLALSTTDEEARNRTFPVNLYEMIDDCESNHQDVAYFYTGEEHEGHGFCVISESKLEPYLRQHKVCKAKKKGEDPKFQSFQRQLNNYGFQKNMQSNVTLYQHRNKSFCKSRKDLLKCISIEKKESRDASGTPSEDDKIKSDLSAFKRKVDQQINDVKGELKKAIAKSIEDVKQDNDVKAELTKVAKRIEDLTAEVCALKRGISAGENSNGKQNSGCKRRRSDTPRAEQETTPHAASTNNMAEEPNPPHPDVALYERWDPIPLSRQATFDSGMNMSDEDLATHASELSYYLGPNEEMSREASSSTTREQRPSSKRRKHRDQISLASPLSATVVTNATNESPFNVVNGPNSIDVLCGEGDFSYHNGNQMHSILVFSHRDNYANRSLDGKREVSCSIVKAIKQAKGRFLERASGQEQTDPSAPGQWFEIGDDAAVEMTLHALEMATHRNVGPDVINDERKESGGDSSDPSGFGGGGSGCGKSEYGSVSRHTGKTSGRQWTTKNAGGPASSDAFSHLETASDTASLNSSESDKKERKPPHGSTTQFVSFPSNTEYDNSRFTFYDLPQPKQHADVCMIADAHGDFERLVSRMLRKDKSLTMVMLRKHEISPNKAKSFACALRCNVTIQCIDLWGNKVGDKGVLAMMPALCRNKTVRVLSLGQNGICKTGALAIAKILPTTCIISLDLENNELGADGAKALSGGIRSSVTLKTLRLGGNRIEDKGAEAIAESIHLNQYIRALYLGRNEMSSKGAASFARALQKNKVLTILDLSENCIRAEGVKKLANSLCKNMSLSTLGLCGNDIGDEGAFTIDEMLRKNIFLTRISLEGCGLNSKLKHSIDSSLKRNETSKAKDDKIALFMRHQAISAPPQNIAVLLSAPLVWKDNKDRLHKIRDSHNFELEKALLTKCVQESRKNIELSFDVAAEGLLRAAAVNQCGCLHFSGHGYPGHLLFEDGVGGADWLEEDKMYEFVNEDSFGLVFASGSNTVCTGKAFIKSGVQHVVCCEQNNTLEDEAAMSFTDEFYSRLLRGFTISAAFEEAKLAVNRKFGSIEAHKFILLPEDSDHQTRIFGSGVVENYTQKAGHDAIPCYPQHIGQEIVLYQVIQLVFSQRAVYVVSSQAPKANTLATAAFKYMSDRRSVLLDIDDIYYIPCDSMERNASAENELPATVLQNGVADTKGKTDKDEVVWEAIAGLHGSKLLIILDGFSCEGAWLLTMMMRLLKGTRGIRFLIFSKKELDLPHPGLDKLCKAVALHDKVSSQ